MKRARRGTVSGFTLLELLAYVAILSVVIGMATTFFVSATRLRMMGNEAMERMQAVDEMGAAFTQTVHMATGVVPGAGKHRTSDDTLVLALPGDDRYAVIGRLRGDDRLVIMRFFDDAPGSPEYLKTFPRALDSVYFTAGGHGAVSMELDLKTGPGSNRAVHRFVATPRSRVEVPTW